MTIIKNPFYYSIGTRVRDDLFMNMLKPKKGDKILDVGCGLGYFTNMMCEQGAECIGIDIDDLCLQYCNKNMLGDYVNVDLTKPPYPFPSNYFDKAICSEVLEHIKNNKVILRELRRIIKPDGILVVSVPCTEGIFKTFWKKIGHNHVDGNSKEYHHHKGYTKQTLSKLLGKYNFNSSQTDYTMVLGVEVIMGLTKIVIRNLQLKKIDSQANALNVDGMLLWEVYKKLFTILLLYAKLEQPLSRIIKGHMIVMKVRLNK